MKEKLITRTIATTHATTICLDVTTVETSIKTFSVMGAGYSKEKLLEALKHSYESDTFKIVAIQESFEVEKLFGVTEKVFLSMATELDPETRKPLSPLSSVYEIE